VKRVGSRQWAVGRKRREDEWKNGMLERFYHGGTEITELEERMSGMME